MCTKSKDINFHNQFYFLQTFKACLIRENLNLPDGFIFNNKENQLKIIEKIRQYQPEIVLCNAIADRHIDHGKSNTLVREACFLSGLQKIITNEAGGKNQKSWRPKATYSYIQWNSIPPDFVVDISGIEFH
jgi:LmbE family N-acetylglucosaminyl deacetylase